MDVAFAQHQRCYSQYAARISAEMPPLAHRMHHLNANLAKRRMRVNASCSRPARQQPLFLGGGFGSTGTKSLLEAMKSLGFVVWHADRSTVPTTTRPSAFRAPIRAAWGRTRPAKTGDATRGSAITTHAAPEPVGPRQRAAPRAAARPPSLRCPCGRSIGHLARSPALHVPRDAQPHRLFYSGRVSSSERPRHGPARARPDPPSSQRNAIRA